MEGSLRLPQSARIYSYVLEGKSWTIRGLAPQVGLQSQGCSSRLVWRNLSSSPEIRIQQIRSFCDHLPLLSIVNLEAPLEFSGTKQICAIFHAELALYPRSHASLESFR